MSKIWMVNQYNMPPDLGHLNRHYYLGKYLKRLGHEPCVFVGSFLHNSDIQMVQKGKLYESHSNSEFPYFFIRTCNYAESRVKRVYAMLEFCINLYRVSKKLEKPEVILGSSAHPLSAIIAIILAKKYHCCSIVEVRDLWPESLVAYNIIKRKSIIYKLLYFGEKWMYKKADKLIFTMEGGKDYIIEQGWDKESGGPINLDKVFHVNNGVDLELFNYNRANNTIQDEDLDNQDTFKVIYAGSIRLVNNVKSIVDAAVVIKNKSINNVKFLIYGEGGDREYLEKFCKDNNLDNVIFKGFVSKKNIPFILSRSNLNIIHFEQNTVKKYGASLNKMFEYFASGKPTVSDCKFGYDLIEKYNCGIVVDDADEEKLADTIIRFSNMSSDEYELYCKNAVAAAKDYDFKVLAKKLEELIK